MSSENEGGARPAVVARFVQRFFSGLEEDRNRGRRAFHTAAAAVFHRLLALFLSLATVPLLLRYLGAEGYGVWATLTSLVALFAVADLGVGGGLLNAVAGARGRGALLEVRNLVATAFALYASVAALLLVALVITASLLDWRSVFNVASRDLARSGGAALLTLGVLFALSLPVAAAYHVRAALQEGYVSALFGALGLLCGFAGLLIAIRERAPMWVLALCTGGGPLLGHMLNTAELFLRRHRWLWSSPSRATRATLVMLSRSAGLFFVLQVAGTVAFSLDNVVAAQVLGPGEVTRYAVPFRLFFAVETLVVTVTMAMWPAYSEALAIGDLAWVRSTLVRSVVGLVVAAGAVAGVLVVAGRSLLTLWVGHAVRVDRSLLVGFGVWLTLSAFGHAVAAFLCAARVIKFQIVSSVSMALLNLFLSVVLAKWVGVSGIIWGTILSYSVCTAAPYALYVPALLRRLEEATDRRTSG